MSVKHEYLGAASGFALVNNAIAGKEKYLGVAPHSRPLYIELLPERLKWEEDLYNQRPYYVYFECDLIASLLELYFTNIHQIFPTLHRPSFERCVAKELYLSNPGFGAVLLAVLAIASRYSDDPRVMVDGNPLSSGWKFVTLSILEHSANLNLKSGTSSLLQLVFMFNFGTSGPLGLGIRFLQHRFEHCRNHKDYEFKNEPWNRAFWSLFILDRMAATFTGHPAAIHT
ncbi:hypothetical protein DFH07DRAFT_949077 [Mycena maculata]|uniref:Xylanolytic transcriptional activator regulatory domain-containing protein n=1 Tax=Mycena maculata TaxID=230809 RepID=A0AAD7P055_9AGAR|nr:hypothetical protein DFH07DRAFT_949077 [Mycena maculata]